mmetsp:Transcript_9858/g.19683  ORF Transcript_9858/g.19683 Transcript_9858/m.19683 type:complete len:321 (-) Transcript_9858:265-1227(-)|eukprot:CAMPEP_0181292948 /NCGR_PEP_ID=MMETSP1101-20121128/2794_1 /TAXON_ID=46948 /ORGANISM="Rhodomonas abbreviata, Strain Caron Lab Isolate" /LENGTH=320 /DNA_ID=CAMNT_0023397483 /DNA_START=227 /DNA_END=1189 /DNA_ORIENTATION=+
MTVEKKTLVGNDENQRARLLSWVKTKCSQSKPQVAKAMRTFLKQLSNDVSPEDIPEGRTLSALERETLIRARKLQVVSDLDSIFPAPTRTYPTGRLLAEWTEKVCISPRELALQRREAVASQAAGDFIEENEEDFCLDMNGREFPPVTGLVDDEKWVQVDQAEEQGGDEMTVSFMDDDDDWVLAVMLELESCTIQNDSEELPIPILNFRRAVIDGPPRPVSQDSTTTDETSEDVNVDDLADQESDMHQGEDASASRGENVLCRSELADERDFVKRDIGAWKKSRSVSEARRILQQTEKRAQQKEKRPTQKKGGKKNSKHV